MHSISSLSFFHGFILPKQILVGGLKIIAQIKWSIAERKRMMKRSNNIMRVAKKTLFI